MTQPLMAWLFCFIIPFLLKVIIYILGKDYLSI